MRRMVSLLLAFALLLGLVAPTLAAERGSSARFTDVSEDDWSLPYVLEMQAKGLMQGTGDGRFQPGAPLTRAQAVTVAIRLMGLEEEAQAFDRIDDMLLPFSDREEIREWARPYIAVAVDQEILPLAEDGLFRPDENATRLWFSVLLVRALGYEAEAQAKMTEELPFRDAQLIPASLVGYVAAAVDHELVQGFPDRTFQPNQPLTRAQAAALLSRTDSQLGDLGRLRPGFLVGELLRTDTRNRTLVMEAQGREREVPVDRMAAIFLEDRAVSLGDLPTGARLSVVVDGDGTALLIIARKPAVDPAKNEVRGKITSLFLPEEMAGGLGLIVIDPPQGKERSFPLAPEIRVTYQGRNLPLGDLRVGDEVSVHVMAGFAISIEVVKRAAQPPDDRVDEIKGVITAVYPYSTSFLGSVEVRTGSRTRSVKIAPGAVITSGGDRIQVTDLQEGDRVTIKVAGGVAIRIHVDEPARREESVKGTIQAVHPSTKTAKARVTVKTDKGARTITLASNVTISHGRTRLKLDDLRKGDQVTVKVVNGIGTEIKVEERAPQDKVEEVKGLIEAVYDVSIAFQSSIEVKTNKGNRTITLANDVAISHGRTRLKLEDLRKGDRVAVKVVNGIGTEIKVEERAPQDKVEEVKGLIEAVYEVSISFQPSIEVKTNKGNRTITLADDVAISHGRTRLKLDDLRKGDRVTVKVVNGVGVEIKVEERGPKDQVEEVKGQVLAVYDVSISFQSSIEVKTDKGSRTVLLAPDATIILGRTTLKLDEIRVGDRVTVKVVNGVGVEIRVEESSRTTEVEGTITGIFRREITLRMKDGKERTLTLAEGATLEYDDRAITLEELYTGDRVELRVRGELILHLEVEDRRADSRD